MIFVSLLAKSANDASASRHIASIWARRSARLLDRGESSAAWPRRSSSTNPADFNLEDAATLRAGSPAVDSASSPTVEACFLSRWTDGSARWIGERAQHFRLVSHVLRKSWLTESQGAPALIEPTGTGLSAYVPIFRLCGRRLHACRGLRASSRLSSRTVGKLTRTRGSHSTVSPTRQSPVR